MLLRRIILGLHRRGLFNRLPDQQALRLLYYGTIGKRLNLKNPTTFNEKLQWLKLYHRKPEYTMMADKYRVREYVANTIGEEYLIPLLGVWEAPEDIDFGALPDQFVLKCNHNSGLGMCICRDKAQLDIPRVRQQLKKGLAQDYYLTGREWVYKDIPRRIIAEKYMEDPHTRDLRDYKFFCFDGRVKALFVAADRQKEGEETKFDFYDRAFRHLDFTNGHPNAAVAPERPVQFEKMLELAERLSAGIPHVRVDLYEAAGEIYFGELTFFHWSGMVAFDPEEWDSTFGSWLELPKKE